MGKGHVTMNTWFGRHFILTREEKMLIGGILLILLCGLCVKYTKQLKQTSQDQVEVELPTPKN